MWANPAMSVNLCYGTAVLEHFVDAFGGHLYPYQRAGRPQGARWHLGTREAVLAAAQALEPHLEIKREIAGRFIEAIRLFPTSSVGVNRKLGQRAWTIERSIAVAEIALTLNPARSRKTNKTAEYLEILRSGLQESLEGITLLEGESLPTGGAT